MKRKYRLNCGKEANQPQLDGPKTLPDSLSLSLLAGRESIEADLRDFLSSISKGRNKNP